MISLPEVQIFRLPANAISWEVFETYYRISLVRYLCRLNIYFCCNVPHTLFFISTRARSMSEELIYHQLSEYLVDVLPSRTNVPSRRITPVARHLTRRQDRKREYSDTQRTWKKSTARCVDTILSGIGATPQPPRERMESHWRDVITEPATGSVPSCMSRPTLDGLWDPFTSGEIKAGKSDLSIPRALTASRLDSCVQCL